MDEVKRGRGMFDGWSKSNLKSVLEGCSWQWALQRLGGLEGGSSPHSAAGTGMHAAIEAHEQARIDGEEPPSLPDLLSIAHREGAADGLNILPSMEAIHGGSAVAAQWAAELTHTWYGSPVRERLMTYTPIAVEPHIETPLMPDAANLRGYLDWFGRDGDGVATVVDYKSAANLKRWSDWQHHLIECSVYLYLVTASGLVGENEPVRMEWHVVSRNGDAGILEGPTFDGDLARFVLQRVEEAQAMLDRSAFTPKPSWNLCSDRWCAFYHGCQVTGILGPDNVDFSTSARTHLPLAPGAGEVERGPLSSAAPSPAPTSDVK